MSFDVELIGEEGLCQIESHEEGGTYAAGGTPDAHLNITYNYSCFYYWFLDKELGLKWLNGKKAKICIKRLEKAVNTLKDKPYFSDRNNAYGKIVSVIDYWAPTPGNAGHALNILLKWAKQHPQARFEVS